jgi:hypothetical protein
MLEMEIERILSGFKGISEEEMLRMILSNRIDVGSETGGLISCKKFDQLITDLIHWKYTANF